MDKKSLEIDQLIVQDLSGVITPEDRIVLENWLGESAENQRYYSEQKKLWNLFSMQQKMQAIDEKIAFQHVSSKLFTPKINWWSRIQRVAAILLVPVLMVSTYYFFSQRKQNNQFSTVFNTAETPLGMRSSLILPDGTKVWLNAGSKLSYPVLFSNKLRTVKLTGEAYFEVKKDKNWPFVVTADNMNIIVSGTTFNCNAYPENNQIQTVLVEGQVTVGNISATTTKVMEPGELAIFRKNTQQITKSKVDLEKYIAWKSGKLMFREDKMNLVVEKLQRWYNVDFEIMDKEISDYIYTATFIDESLDQVLKMLSISAPIRYTVSVRDKQEDQTFARQTVKLYKKKI
ncbi:MAG: FecR domain-containing protein [Prolixibacteraceae bacterium]